MYFLLKIREIFQPAMLVYQRVSFRISKFMVPWFEAISSSLNKKLRILRHGCGSICPFWTFNSHQGSQSTDPPYIYRKKVGNHIAPVFLHFHTPRSGCSLSAKTTIYLRVFVFVLRLRLFFFRRCPFHFFWKIFRFNSWKLTWLAVKSTMNEDVFAKKNWDFPTSHVSFQVSFDGFWYVFLFFSMVICTFWAAEDFRHGFLWLQRFTPLESGLGGIMIGTAAAMSYLIDGRITGISGALDCKMRVVIWWYGDMVGVVKNLGGGDGGGGGGDGGGGGGGGFIHIFFRNFHPGTLGNWFESLSVHRRSALKVCFSPFG